MSDTSASSPADSTAPPLKPHASSSKRSAADAGLKSNASRPSKSVKRRASKACQCCRARKVRCNVVEHGPPCTNCRLDEVECVVSESKRKKKWTAANLETSPRMGKTGLPFKPAVFPMSAQPPYEPLNTIAPQATAFQDAKRDVSTASSTSSIAAPLRPTLYTPAVLPNLSPFRPRLSVSESTTPMVAGAMSPAPSLYNLPLYVKPLPSRLDPADILFLEKKGALTIPAVPLRNELLKDYAEFVHPYMPLLNIHDLVRAINSNDGASPISLLLFQAVMFSAVAFVDLRYLKAAGFSSRRDARRQFFQKTRLLYDFDIETDRVSLIQSLLLMTYWYETPDDQKDSHHWMGIAVALCHTIGMHRNPEKSNSLDPARRKLWKRIWWSTYMRDRLVALGMRRPTRIKTADFDVPMLTLDDFESDVIPDGPSCIPSSCRMLRDLDMQRQLAVMCVEKAKLCVCMSHVLSVQYSVLNLNQGVTADEGNTKTTVRLVARKHDLEHDEVQSCDDELSDWLAHLPEEAQYIAPALPDGDLSQASLVLNRSLLHMTYHATSSALHRPQVLPSTTMPRPLQSEMLDYSRKAVRLAAGEITSIANALDSLDLIRLLPTTGITVLLPAIIIHLLDIKAPDEATRRTSLQGFCQCMQMMGRLRNSYAAADYSTAFLEAAIRKAEISLPTPAASSSSSTASSSSRADDSRSSRQFITSAQGLVDAGRRLQLVPHDRDPSGKPTLLPRRPLSDPGALTPPPDDRRSRPSLYSNRSSLSGLSSSTHMRPANMHSHLSLLGLTVDQSHLSEDDIAHKLNTYLASTPPDSDSLPDSHLLSPIACGPSATLSSLLSDYSNPSTAPSSVANSCSALLSGSAGLHLEFEPDFDALINLDAAGAAEDAWSLGDADGKASAAGGASNGFVEMNWLQGMRNELEASV